MSGWVSCSAEAVQSAAASAATAFVAAHLLARTAPARFGMAGIVARCVAASVASVAAATVCLVVPGFLLIFGAKTWPSALRSAAHNFEISLVAAASLGACLSLIKTRLLRRAGSGTVWIAADFVATAVLALAVAAIYRLIWQIRTGLDAEGGLAGFFEDQRVRAAVLCLPLAASGWAWASAALAGQPEPRRRWLIGCLAAAAAGLWGGLFAPF